MGLWNSPLCIAVLGLEIEKKWGGRKGSGAGWEVRSSRGKQSVPMVVQTVKTLYTMAPAVVRPPYPHWHTYTSACYTFSQTLFQYIDHTSGGLPATFATYPPTLDTTLVSFVLPFAIRATYLMFTVVKLVSRTWNTVVDMATIGNRKGKKDVWTGKLQSWAW